MLETILERVSEGVLVVAKSIDELPHTGGLYRRLHQIYRAKVVGVCVSFWHIVLGDDGLTMTCEGGQVDDDVWLDVFHLVSR